MNPIPPVDEQLECKVERMLYQIHGSLYRQSRPSRLCVVLDISNGCEVYCSWKRITYKGDFPDITDERKDTVLLKRTTNLLFTYFFSYAARNVNQNFAFLCERALAQQIFPNLERITDAYSRSRYLDGQKRQGMLHIYTYDAPEETTPQKKMKQDVPATATLAAK